MISVHFFLLIFFRRSFQGLAQIADLIRVAILNLVRDLHCCIRKTRKNCAYAVAIGLVLIELTLKRAKISQNYACAGYFDFLQSFFPPFYFLDGGIRRHLCSALFESVYSP